ncbi:MAG: transketolase [Chloroflexi bacterium]|nr:transketolase [Chloroflexota bacterium]
MRTAFAKTLVELARQDKRIWLLVGDLGYSVVEPFMQEFPERFVNMGVAEQNMTGVAAGLALSGKVVFTYSIANFPTMRCLEQIRNDVCYHNASVKIVVVGGGLAYGALGMTHHATEDIAIMRALPNMTVVAPGDPLEAALVTKAAVNTNGPFYLRLGKAGEPVVHKTTPPFQIGKALRIREGRDITLVSTGGMLYNSLKAANELEQQNIGAGVLSMHTVKPIDAGAIRKAAQETRAILTIEEHSILGGLGSAVAEVLAETSNHKVAFARLGIPDSFCCQAGSQDYLRGLYSLSVSGIAEKASQLLKSKVV